MNFWSPTPRRATKILGIKCEFLLTQTVVMCYLHSCGGNTFFQVCFMLPELLTSWKSPLYYQGGEHWSYAYTGFPFNHVWKKNLCLWIWSKRYHLPGLQLYSGALFWLRSETVSPTKKKGRKWSLHIKSGVLPSSEMKTFYMFLPTLQEMHHWVPKPAD